MLALEGVATSEEPTVQQNMKYVGRLDAPKDRGVSRIPYHTIPCFIYLDIFHLFLMFITWLKRHCGIKKGSF